MLVELNSVQTLAVVLITLQFGYLLLARIDVLRRNYIPAPVIGGLTAAVVLLLLRNAGLDIRLDGSLQPLFFAGFFASIGFRASTQILKDGMPKVAVFLVLTVALATLQKVIGMFLAPVFGLSRAAGFLASSGHMGGAPLQPLAVPVLAGQGAPELLPLLGATATLGLLLGGFLGGPIYALLTKGERNKPLSPPTPPPLAPMPLIKHLCAYFVVVSLGLWLGPTLNPWVPFFAVALVAASLWRMVDDKLRLTKLELPYINVLGNLSLSITLTLAFSNIALDRVSNLPAGAYALAFVQIALALAVAALVTYRIMGKTPLAAMIAAGLPGFSVGMPPNTMATLQNIQEQNAPMPLATFVVPVVGAWLITFINPWIFEWLAKLL